MATTWTYWTCTSTSTSSSDTTGVWHNWSGGTSSSATTSDTWTCWDYVETEYSAHITHKPPREYFLTRHYQKMQVEINRIWRQVLADWLREEREAAEATARALLLDLVSQKEFELYEKTGYLLVKGRKQSYIVKQNGGVDIIVNPEKLQGMCVHLNRVDKNKCPETDNVIAMKLHIEQAEEEFLKTANHHRPRDAYLSEKEFLRVVNE